MRRLILLAFYMLSLVGLYTCLQCYKCSKCPKEFTGSDGLSVDSCTSSNSVCSKTITEIPFSSPIIEKKCLDRTLCTVAQGSALGVKITSYCCSNKDFCNGTEKGYNLSRFLPAYFFSSLLVVLLRG